MTRVIPDGPAVKLSNPLDILDQICTEIETGNPNAVYELGPRLEGHKGATDVQGWSEFINAARNHQLMNVVLQDPAVRHSFERPRGYAGDADLLDYVYGIKALPPETTALGRDLYNSLLHGRAASSVRYRRDLLAGRIDSLAEVQSDARILSVACGYLREAQASEAVLSGRIGELVGLDQDPETISFASQLCQNLPVRLVNSGLLPILNRKFESRPFHFIYSAGLYDYLDQRMASRLTARLFDLLTPGGTLLIGNFSPALPDRVYMELFMDWFLIYRTEEEVRLFADEIPGESIAEIRTFHDPAGDVVYLEVRRR